MNTINLHNYETWFLLWIDGELSTQDMEMVERFIADHPDLAEELALLQETRLPIDESYVFPDKASLLRQETDSISLANYETYFLLYVDNELSATDQQATELFVLQHPNLQESFLLLQQTKLVAEKIEFGNKALLYRKEEKKKPVIFMRFTSIAVAAAMFGLVATLWFVVPQNNLKKQFVLPVDNATVSTPSNKPTNEAGKRLLEQEPATRDMVLSTIANKPINNLSNKANNQQIAVSRNEATIPQTASNQPIIAAVPTEKTLTNNQLEQTSVQANTVYDESSSISKLTAAEEKKLMEDQQATAKQEDGEENTESLAKPASYKELDTNDDKSLYIGALEINKDKLRGFLRKAGSVFRSKSKQEEDTRILK